MAGSGYTLVLAAVAIMSAEAVSPPITVVPGRPKSVSLEKSALFYLWNEQLDYQGALPAERDTQPIGTLLSPGFFHVVNLVPQDAPHPLYVNSYAELRAALLRDHMLQDTVDPNDSRMKSTNGLTAKTLTGKSVVFKKDNTDRITVNNIPVENVETLSEGIVSYTLDGVLFDYVQQVDDAFHEYLRNSSSRDAQA
ncbi:uncharacterized protein LOC125027369 [Penaeus chinensis]|uniref:uncharacterized protein LOC125027369 n=1 Tax=Penaeus chinensis TaxID=139456 RepID=UPI001FB7342E|nr:uncharacterized protein LOC125027369 [Penaeus chinensis]